MMKQIQERMAATQKKLDETVLGALSDDQKKSLETLRVPSSNSLSRCVAGLRSVALVVDLVVGGGLVAVVLVAAAISRMPIAKRPEPNANSGQKMPLKRRHRYIG